MTAPVARAAGVFDAHVDSLQLALDLGEDLAQGSRGHLDLPRARAGGVSAVVFVSWIDPLYLEPEHAALGGPARRARELLGAFHDLAARAPDSLKWAGNGQGLDDALAAGALAGIPGIEGGHAIEESLERLEWFFERGVRVLTLVWNNHLTWIRSCQALEDNCIGIEPERVPAGLSDFGREVVRAMNELGMLVDLSHAGEQAFFEALETSARPVIASHSGCRAISDHPRNLTDDQLRALAQQGGVVGLVFCTAFLDAAARRAETDLRESSHYRALRGRNHTELFSAQSHFLQEHAPPLSLERLLDHMLHAIEVAGIEHVGVGSDFDGIQRTPAGLEDASCYPALGAGLRARGLNEDEVARVLGGNMERVFREATGAGTRAASAELVPLG